MAIPKYDELYPDFLTALISGAPRAVSEIRNEIALRRHLTAEELRAAWDCVDGNFRETLRQAADNIRHFHEAQVHRDFCLTDRPGVVLGQRYTPGWASAYPAARWLFPPPF